MRVVLEVLTGSRTGHRLLLNRDQTYEVGRSPLVDLAFEHDQTMSGCHFKLRAERSGCQLEDLQSTNGTFVNGQPVRKAALRHKDTVFAGQTEFRVHVEDMQDVTGSVTGTAEYDSPRAVFVANYTSSVCKSGVICCQGKVDAMPPSSLMQALGQAWDQLLIVDTNKLELPQRLDGNGTEYFFNWLPEVVRPLASPVLVTSSQQMGRVAVVDEAWGKDALVAVFWEKEEEPPLDELRRSAGAFARPSVLRPQLRSSGKDYVQGLFSGVKAVAIEGDSPDTWEIYSPEDIDPVLAGVGLSKVIPAPVTGSAGQHASMAVA